MSVEKHLRARGVTLAQVAVQTVLHAGLRFGQGERVDPTLERLLGRPPRTTQTHLEDHQALWNSMAAARTRLRV